MKYIELVIKIPEYGYKDIVENDFIYDEDIENDPVTHLIKIIKNGIALPKGHGRLIDVSELLTVTDIREDGSEVTYVLYDDIENASTIIEADKE